MREDKEALQIKLIQAIGRGALQDEESEEVSDEETKIMIKSKKKKNLVGDIDNQNFMMIVGAEPGGIVDADTKLIKDTMKTFLEQFDIETLTVEFPKILQNLQGSDAKIEIMQSTTLQSLRLSVEGNNPDESKAYIFVQPKLQRGGLAPLEYFNAEGRAEAAVEFFRDVLEFEPKNVIICRDYSKAQVIEQLNNIDE